MLPSAEGNTVSPPSSTSELCTIVKELILQKQQRQDPFEFIKIPLADRISLTGT
jgi:hypothetical protein